MTIAISVKLPKALAAQLSGVAKEAKRSRSFIIQKALENCVEDFADHQIAKDRLQDKNNSIVSAKEMRTSLAPIKAKKSSNKRKQPGKRPS